MAKVTPYNKAIAAGILAALLYALAQFDIQLPDAVKEYLMALIAVSIPVAVYAIRNRGQMDPELIRQAYAVLQEQLRAAEEKPLTIHREEMGE